MPNLGLASAGFFNYYYFWLYFAVTFLVYLYKVLNLPYPSGNIFSEISILFLLCSIESMRLYLSRKGNLTDSWAPLTVSLVLTGPSVLGVLYFLLWQTYVLRVEVILVYVEIIFESLTFILGLLHLITLLYYKG